MSAPSAGGAACGSADPLVGWPAMTLPERAWAGGAGFASSREAISGDVATSAWPRSARLRMPTSIECALSQPAGRMTTFAKGVSCGGLYPARARSPRRCRECGSAPVARRRLRLVRLLRLRVAAIAPTHGGGSGFDSTAVHNDVQASRVPESPPRDSSKACLATILQPKCVRLGETGRGSS